MLTSRVRMGSIVVFSGCRRTWSGSLNERDDDLAVGRRVLPAHDDEVAVEDAGVDHRVAAHAEDELALVTAGDRRHRHVVLDVLLREDRLARGDLADQRQPALAAHDALRGVDRLVEHLDRPRLRRIPPQQADLLQVGQVRVHRRG
jgi:zona occludens toxin (predicted ATPase)